MAWKRITLVGFGEVGQIFAADLGKSGQRSIRAFDIAFADDASPQSAAARKLGIAASAKASDALAEAELVVCAVTAGATLQAVGQVAPSLPPGAVFLEVNSVAPATKQAAAALIAATPARYVEAAVMAAVPPKRIATPILLGGPHAAAARDPLRELGFSVEVFSDAVGGASSVKMCRSVVIKGLEALFLESMLAARHYGVEDDVLATLTDTFPGLDIRRMAGYMTSRALQHGRRRAEEMREVARTVADAGLAPLLSAPIAERQDWAADIGSRVPTQDLKGADLSALLRAIEGIAAAAE